MNNKVNDKTYIKLTPFKGWVLENFPFIESDFDCITNYQLLCKITEYLNNVISNQNQVQQLGTELVTAYDQLLDYVNNYFNNLDVQEEINNKLDEMAEDGTLSNLISNYLTPIINQQNQQITLINNKVNSVASGSPIPVSSVSQMTDTSRVYVLTTDGNWYYYNGDSWEIGGTYQSTGIGLGDVKFSNLDDDLKGTIYEEKTITDVSWQLLNNSASGYKFSSYMFIPKGTVITISSDFVANYHWAIRRVYYNDYIRFSFIKNENTDLTYTFTNDEYCIFSFRPIDNDWDSETYNVDKTYIPTSTDISLKYYVPIQHKDLLEDIDNSYFNSLLNVCSMDGALKTFMYATTRVATSKPLKSTNDIKVICKPNYRYGIIRWSSDIPSAETFISDSGWTLPSVILTIPANTYFTISYRREDNASLTLDELHDVLILSSMGTYNYISNYVENKINSIGNYNYTGEKIDFQNKHGYESTKYEDTIIAHGSSQGFDVYNNYLVQLYNGGYLQIIDLSTYTQIADISGVGFSHGDTCQFSNKKYSESDLLPLLYVTSDLTPSIVHVVRIQNTTTASIIESYDLGINAGYYAGHCFDFENNLIYSFGYKTNSYTSDVNNATIISVYNMSNKTLISEHTYNLQLVERYEKPFIYCIQGQKFFNGKCFLISSYSPSQSPNIIYIYDPIRKLIVSKFENLPSPLDSSELEDLCFILDSNSNYYNAIIGTRSAYYKIIFM